MSRKTAFFEGWSWFKFNNLGLALGTNLKLYTSLSKELKLKVRKFWRVIPTFVEVTGEKLVGGGAFWPYVTISGNFERLQNFNFETHFLKTHFFFQKTGVSFFS